MCCTIPAKWFSLCVYHLMFQTIYRQCVSSHQAPTSGPQISNQSTGNATVAPTIRWGCALCDLSASGFKWYEECSNNNCNNRVSECLLSDCSVLLYIVYKLLFIIYKLLFIIYKDDRELYFIYKKKTKICLKLRHFSWTYLWLL